MWREIEGEHVVNRSQLRVGDRLPQETIDGLSSNPVNTYFSERQDNHGGDSLENGTENANECQAWPQGQMGLQNDNEEGNSSSSEQSIDFGEAERGRVRQIFQGWMNNGSTGHASNCSQANRNLRAQQLEENEYERVRNVREWVRLTSQQRGTCSSGEGQAAEIATRVHNGFFVNQREFGARRNIRKLCGRQALVDLLARAKQERQRELQHLLEHRPVSDFAHRNRIQSLLRGRFLRSGRLVQDKKPSSLAANELGLLRQRHTVAGLREGFLSRLDNFDRCPSVSARSDTSSNIDINNFVNENSQTNSLQVNLNVNQEWFGPRNGVRDTNQSCTFPLEGDTGQDTINWQEATAQEEQYVRNFENEENRLPSSSSVSIGKNSGIGENIGESCGEGVANSWPQNSGVEGQEEHVQRHQLSSHEVPERCEPIGEECEQTVLSGEEFEVLVSLNHADNHESSTTEGMHWPPTSVQVEERREPFTDNADSDWQPENDYEFSEWRDDDDGEGTYVNESEGTANDWVEGTLGTEGGGEEHHVQELHGGWHDNDLLEATDNFLDEPFSWQATPAGRFSTSYFPDDDNTYSSEIRELLNRRSVSNLLQSDFRVSLDQLIQSYAERQAHASDNWEPDGTSLSPGSPALVEEDVQDSGAQDQGQSDVAEGASLALPAQPFTPQPFWDQELLDDNWSQNHSRHGLGIEWEIINDLRIDMARLQQRMNNMQRMLEACMDMQLELQRAVRQELSAALNMSAGSTVSDDDENLKADQSKWDHVRKRICCICCDKNIDSLLYRCGHMCTCSKCADKLVQRGGKCPMCQAPVVEMIRAYFAQ
ncbi:uncharacterized protein LOC127802693 isoform X2 [Diospyros lotus]|nr:uncharacterized protein LOC127802693 isoform X2 [Diospyros lotus]XP_052194653.1 uncharacterized protein LOC127802693 isoform X2 [Diospyros lotus]XP_052194660.1 uncharacterized protein LOC127802693 isoform X2 [Diospyros lotus]